SLNEAEGQSIGVMKIASSSQIQQDTAGQPSCKCAAVISFTVADCYWGKTVIPQDFGGVLRCTCLELRAISATRNIDVNPVSARCWPELRAMAAKQRRAAQEIRARAR